MLSALARFYSLPFDHPSEVHAASEWITHPTPASTAAAPSPTAADKTSLTNGADVPVMDAADGESVAEGVAAANGVVATDGADGRPPGDDVITATGLDAKAGVALAEVVNPAR